MKVAIKPNLVVPGPASNGAVTHPEVVEGIVLYLHSLQVFNIEIIESSWVGESSTYDALLASGFKDLCGKYEIPFFDLKKDEITKIQGMEVCKKALDADFLINVPVLKAHCQTKMTCCLKNLKGCISDKEKRRFHTMGLHGPIARLGTVLKPDFNVIDGICGDLSFEEGGMPVARNILMAGDDALTLDTYCAQLLGYSPDDIAYLSNAIDLGVGKAFDEETEILALNLRDKPMITATDIEGLSEVTANIIEDQACSACYCSLVFALQRVDTKEPLCIGQGFKGKTGKIGIGSCTKDFAKSLPGCPPRAKEMVAFIKCNFKHL
jgi:uncharacterized protein (DUF362 family)